MLRPGIRLFHPHITILVLICLIFNKSKCKLILSCDHTLQYLESDVTLDVQCQNYIELQPIDIETEYHCADAKRGNAKNTQTTAQLHSSHMLVK